MSSTVWFGSGLGATALALFFALTTYALRSFSRARLEEALRRRRRLGSLRHFYEHHDELVQTTGLLYILALVATTTLFGAWAVAQFEEIHRAWLIGLAVAAGLALTFGGAIPMAWAKYAPETVLIVTLPVLQACRSLVLPFLRAVRLLDRVIGRLAGVTGKSGPVSYIEEEIRSVAGAGEREGVLEEGQRAMIERVLRFRKADVGQVMTPRTDIVSLEADASLEQARIAVTRSGFSRLPVVQGNLDAVVGFLYAKDLLARAGGADGAATSVRDIMRKPFFVPETKRLDELLSEFRTAKMHIAVVLDEYGGTAGLVSIEDILEEIVGEIVDEYEEAPPQPMRRLDDGAWAVEARVRINELNSGLSIRLPEGEDYETIGGLVLSRLGYIPKAGQTLQVEGLKITVLEAEERRIMRLRIDLLPQTKETEA